MLTAASPVRRQAHPGLSLRRAIRLWGLSLEITLVVLLFSPFLAGVQAWVAKREQEQRSVDAGYAVSLLSAAGRQYLQADYPALVAGVGSGREVTVADLQGEDLLPAAFNRRGPLKRDLTVFILPDPGQRHAA